ncbi:peptide deformylase [Alteromonadaceae bacterium Bs31]|nr:peptide deformylase [Alteromonadaceae bacterium Bs31]
MALLSILEFPDPRLRTVAKTVPVVDDRVRKIIDDMFETMYAAPGVGLAATQVNIHEQIIVIDTSEDKTEPLVFINPQVEVIDETLSDYEEGCLSVPGFYEEITRPCHVRVTALNRAGEQFVMEPKGLLAVCIQHELDHLKGKLFVDYISNMKRDRIRKKLEKQHRSRA